MKIPINICPHCGEDTIQGNCTQCLVTIGEKEGKFSVRIYKRKIFIEQARKGHLQVSEEYEDQVL